LTKRLVERAMEVELTDHLGYEHGEARPGGTGNTRDGSTAKTAPQSAALTRGPPARLVHVHGTARAQPLEQVIPGRASSGSPSGRRRVGRAAADPRPIQRERGPNALAEISSGSRAGRLVAHPVADRHVLVLSELVTAVVARSGQ